MSIVKISNQNKIPLPLQERPSVQILSSKSLHQAQKSNQEKQGFCSWLLEKIKSVFRGLLYLITCRCFRKQKKELGTVSESTTSPLSLLENSSKKKVESQQTAQKTQEVVSETISSPSKKNARPVILSATIIPDPVEKDKDDGIGKVQTSKSSLPIVEREDGFGENITEEDSDKEDGKTSLVGTYSDGKFSHSN